MIRRLGLWRFFFSPRNSVGRPAYLVLETNAEENSLLVAECWQTEVASRIVRANNKAARADRATHERQLLAGIGDKPSAGAQLAGRLGYGFWASGNIYLELMKLEERGLIRSYNVAEDLEERGGRPRRYYELTSAGGANR